MKNVNKVLGIFLLSILIFCAISNVALAAEDENDNDNDGVDDDVEDLNERDTQVEVDDDQIQIQSELKVDTTKHELQINVELQEEGLKIKVEYKSGEENNNEENDNDDSAEEQADEADLEFKIVFQSLIEFVDVNGDGIYDPATDITNQTLALNSFDKPDYKKDEDSEGTTIHIIEITTTDGVFTAILHVSEGFTEIDGDQITPTEVKIDIEINNFNYLNDSSQIALKTKLESEVDYDEEDETEDEKEGYNEDEDEEGTKTEVNGEIGFFTWKDTAMVDGNETPVLSSGIVTTDNEDDGEQKIYLCYKRGTSIVHDPKIGVESSLLTTAPINVGLIVIVVSVLAAGSIAAIAFILHRRRYNLAR